MASLSLAFWVSFEYFDFFQRVSNFSFSSLANFFFFSAREFSAHPFRFSAFTAVLFVKSLILARKLKSIHGPPTLPILGNVWALRALMRGAQVPYHYIAAPKEQQRYMEENSTILEWVMTYPGMFRLWLGWVLPFLLQPPPPFERSESLFRNPIFSFRTRKLRNTFWEFKVQTRRPSSTGSSTRGLYFTTSLNSGLTCISRELGC